MTRTKPFRFLAFTTYLPMPLLGLMIIFYLIGKLFNIGWLESAPDVLMIPMLLAYYISLIMGSIYGYLKREDGVYIMAVISIVAWIIAMLLGMAVSFPRQVMYVINGVFVAAFIVLHLFQYKATKRWEARLTKPEK